MTEFNGLRLFSKNGKPGLLALLVASLCLWGQAAADSTITSSGADSEIRVDGSLGEWQSTPALRISPDASDIAASGEFKDGDFDFKLRSKWNKQYLYLAIEWQDDTWDIEEVTRKEATWHDPDSAQRRDRMYFFDNFKFHIRESDYDYTLWVSPQDGDNGPYHWARLLMGYRGNERAGAKPMLRASSNGDTSYIEMMIVWKQLKLKPKNGLVIPIRLTVTDSDLPGRFEETKVSSMKSVEWVGNLTLID